MNKLFCVEYFLSITMGSVYLKAHTKLYGAVVAQRSTSLTATRGKM